MTTRDRFRGALLGCLLGDAFGSVLEGTSPDDPQLEQRLATRRVERRPWRYTDDTELALGLAQSLVDCGKLDGDHLLDTWSAQYEPARGYGRGMKLALKAWRAGTSPSEAAWSEGSNGSGAAVRVVAIACLFHHDVAALESNARRAAALTHRGDLGVAGAVLHARAIALALRQQSALDATEFLGALASDSPKLTQIPGLLQLPPRAAAATLGNGLTADESVPLALYAFLRGAPDFEDVVLTTARCGGDVDTIAAMGGTLAGASLGASKLPRRWLENAEGVGKATALADALYDLWHGMVREPWT